MIMAGGCERETRWGECPYCHGNLTNGHNCPQRQAAEEALESMLKQPTKLAKMIKLWVAVNELEQEQIAKAWGAAPSAVSRFLSGTTLPDGRTMARIIGWLLEP